MKFTKMHGCGNDYVYINGFEEHIDANKKPEFVREISDRHTGVGGDGAIFINPSDVADFEMEMWNADGTRSEMCGNGIRCVGKYVYDHQLTNKTEITVVSFGAIKYLQLNVKDGKVETVRVDMGEPIFIPEDVPVDLSLLSDEKISYATALPGAKAVKAELEINDKAYEFTCVSMGNPHGVTYVGDVYSTDVEEIGSKVEVHPFFPRRTNVEFIHVVDRSHIDMRVWERGTGETQACGTGACGSVASCIMNGLTDNTVEVTLLGGKLTINWEGPGHHLFMTGPATEVFNGEI